MSDHKIFTLEEINDALNDIRNKFLTGKDLVWTGPDHLHSSISASSSPPSFHFSKKGLKYHEEQGRGFWDVYNMIAAQLGLHNGMVKQEKIINHYSKVLDILLEITKETV